MCYFSCITITIIIYLSPLCGGWSHLKRSWSKSCPPNLQTFQVAALRQVTLGANCSLKACLGSRYYWFLPVYIYHLHFLPTFFCFLFYQYLGRWLLKLWNEVSALSSSGVAGVTFHFYLTSVRKVNWQDNGGEFAFKAKSKSTNLPPVWTW